MLNFRDRNDLLPSALILLSLLTLLATLLFDLFVPKPSVAGIVKPASLKLQEAQKATKLANQRIATEQAAIGQRLWSGRTDRIGGTILAQLNALALTQKVSISAFRPQRIVELNGADELPITVQMTGPYHGIHAIMATLDQPGSRVVLESSQLASSQTVGVAAGVTATVGLSAFVAPPPPAPAGQAGGGGGGAASGS